MFRKNLLKKENVDLGSTEFEETCQRPNAVDRCSNVVQRANDTVDKVNDVVLSASGTLTNMNDAITNIGNIAQNALSIYQQSLEIKKSIATIQAVKEVELTKIVKKYELCHDVLSQIFGQRQEGLNAHYESLERALASNDRELVIASLQGISNIVTSSPLEDFTKFLEIWDDDNKELELDF